MNSEETVKSGCFGPSRGSSSSSVGISHQHFHHHGRTGSKGSLFQKFWSAGIGTGSTGSDPSDLQLERLTEELMMLGFDVDPENANSKKINGKQAQYVEDSPTHGADEKLIEVAAYDEEKEKGSMKAFASAGKHARRRSWSFGMTRRVAPMQHYSREEVSTPSINDDTLVSSSREDKNMAGSLESIENGILGNSNLQMQCGSGYRKLWQTIASVRKGEKISTSELSSVSKEPQNFTVEMLVKKTLSLKSSQSILDANELIQGLGVLDSRALAALLKELAKAGVPNRAGELFDYIRSVPEDSDLYNLADVYTYTTVISQCGAHQYLRRALELVAEMRSRGIEANIHTYSALMSVCVKCNECQLALDVYEQLKAEGLTPNMVTYNILIDSYSRLGQWSLAADVLDLISDQELIPEARTYNAIIAACGKAGQPNSAMEIYKRMLLDGVEPTGTTYTSIISAFGRSGRVDDALNIYRQMSSHGCEPNVITYSSLISVCERAGRVDDALRIYSEMEESGVRPNVVTFNGLIAACAGAGMASKAADIMNSMSSAGCRPDTGTFSSLISAYERTGQWREVLQTFEKMRNMHIRPDAAAYNSVLGALWDSGCVPALRKAILLLTIAQRQGALRYQTISAGESTCIAYSNGAAVLVILRWFANFRDGLAAGAFGGAQPTARSLLLTKGKHAPWDHSFEAVGSFLRSIFAAYSVPVTVDLVPQGLRIQGDGQILSAWTCSPSSLALLSILDFNNSMGNLPSVSSMIREDKSGELQCSKAFAAVRDFEARRATDFDSEKLDVLFSSKVSGMRKEIIACLSALSNALNLREETAHDAIQLCDMLLASAHPAHLASPPETAAALLLASLRQTGNAAAILRQGQMVLQAAGLPLSSIMNAEQQIYTYLGSSPAAISPFRVLQLFLERIGCELPTLHKCQFLQVMVLSASDAISKAALSPAVLHFDPSVVAAACIIKARESIGIAPVWPLCLRDMTGFEGPQRPDISNCLRILNAISSSR